jgi:hypothetical protein
LLGAALAAGVHKLLNTPESDPELELLADVDDFTEEEEIVEAQG